MPINPDRLRALRQFHSLTQGELAGLVAVSQPTIADYEAGHKEPQPQVVEALAVVLKVDPQFLGERDDDVFTEPEMNFRGRRSASETLKKKVIAQATLFGVVVRELRKHIPTMPPLDVPSFPVEDIGAVDSSAEKARVHWGLGVDGPIHSMIDVLENAGVVLTVADADTAEKVDAFSRYGNTSVVVLNTAKASPSRSFFDTAHEAAHGVLHYGQPAKTHEQREEEAQRFAGAFLMPRRPFTRDFWSKGSVDWANLLEMKEHWGASLQAILVRASQLKLIDAAVYRTAFRELSMRGWRTDEPQEPDPEYPKLFGLALQQYEKRTKRTVRGFVSDLFMTPQLFTQVTGAELAAAGGVKIVSLSERRTKRNAPEVSPGRRSWRKR